jgi:hypothetical protein
MGELISFNSRLRHRALKAGPTASVEATSDSTAKQLALAVDLLDQMAAKIDQMNRLLPTHLVARFEKQQLEVRDQINQAHLKVELLSGFSKD